MVAYKIQHRNEAEITSEIATYIRIGMLSKRCKGFGICEVQALAKSNYLGQEVYKKVVCHITRINDSELIFSFFPRTMSSSDHVFYFGNSNFVVGEDFELRGEVARELGIHNFTIKRGDYSKYVVGAAHNVIF